MENKRITSIDLWKFLFVIAIVINNINKVVWQEKGVSLVFTGSLFASFFMFISGYFLMEHLKNDKSRKDCSIKALNYTKKRISYVYPAMVGGITLAFVIRNIILKTNLRRIFRVFMNSLFEFLGLSQIGIKALNTGITGLWNEPLWYLSALVIVSFILYYILAKNEDFFVGILAPVLIIINFALNSYQDFAFPLSLLRVATGLTIGILSYYVVNYFKKKKFSETLMMVFSILHIALAMFFIYTSYTGFSWNYYAYAFLMLIFAIVLLVNKDYVAVLYNDSSLCYFLGRLTLYFYCSHIGFAYLLAWMFPSMSYPASIIFNLLFTGCWSFIMMYVDDYVISPLFRKKNAKI